MSVESMTHILVDDFYIDRSWGIKRVLHPVRKYPGNPIMRPEVPAEGTSINLFGTVVRDPDGTFRMWYQGYSSDLSDYHALYATSHDGVHWERPNLGLVEFQGNSNNNLISKDMALVNVMEDLRETDPDRRYKSLYFAQMGQKAASRVCVAFSADGVKWVPYEGNPVIENASDTHTLLGWDEKASAYVAYTRPRLRTTANWTRVIGRSTSEDFIHWNDPETVLETDAADPPALELYGMPVFWHEGIYFGLPWAYHAYEEEPPVRMEAEVDAQLAVSHDGTTWERLGNRQAFIPRGGPGTFDARGIYTAKAPVRVGDELWFYYGGAATYHHDGTRPAYYTLGLARIGLNRFVSIEQEDGNDQESWILTKPFTCEGTRLTVNANAVGGQVAVSVLDEEGRQIPGFSRIDSVLIDGDGIAQPVSWRMQATLESLSGRSIRFKFYLRRAQLFAYTIDQG